MIGFGSIGRAVIELMPEAERNQCVGILVRAGKKSVFRDDPKVGTLVSADLQEILGMRPSVVVECAGHGALFDYGLEVLRAGCDLLAVSSGALADERLEKELREASLQGQRRVIIPAGAIVGIDGIAAAAVGGLSEVIYRGCKPPAAWRGSPAESLVQLEGLEEQTVFFQGSARQAARQYPKNANVAATVALAGLGFEKTKVKLVADPGLTANRHEVTACGAFGSLSLAVDGKHSPTNPRTSMQTAYSVVRCLRNELGSGVCL